jgi:hypothetical protein
VLLPSPQTATTGDVGLFATASRWMSKKGASVCAEEEKEAQAWWKTVDEALLGTIDDR